MPTNYAMRYRDAAQITEKDKAQKIKKVCELLWADDDFFKAIVRYAQTARRDIDWQ